MLPLAEDWYRRQLLAAVFLGVFGGIFALAFSVVTIWRRSLIPAIVAHFIFNFVNFVSMLTQDPEWQ